MLCKKCKTALPENEKECKYCGTKTGSGKTIIMVLLALILVGVVVVLGMSFSGKKGKPNSPEVSTAVANTPVPSTIKIPSATTEIPESEKYTTVATPAPAPVFEANLSMDSEKVWEMVKDLSLAINEYFEGYDETTILVSRNGYCYDLPASEYISPSHLMELTAANPAYANEQVLFLYVKPVDLSTFGKFGAEIGTELTRYCAYETREGFAIARDGEKVGIVPREDFQKLIENYKESANAVRFEHTDEEFIQMLEAINIYKGTDVEFDVRYLVGDDRFGFVVLSEAGTPQLVKEYILQVTDKGYVVVLDKFEKEHQYQEYVNRRFPNLCVDIFPKFNLGFHLNFIKADFEPMIKDMRDAKMIEEADGKATFATGTEKFAYFEFESGKKLLAVLTDDKGWMLFPVVNYIQAEAYLSQSSLSAPYFIIKQE